MSLVNAFINQIGREIGRDVYRNVRVRPSKHIPTSSYFGFNQDFIDEIKSFELAAYDKVSVRNIINLIEKSENINPRSFNWQDCYIELDNKIDFCKENLDKDHLEKLESLDQQNSINFSIAKEKHKNFILETIENIKLEIANHEKRNLILAFIASILGFNPIFYRLNFGKIFGHLLGTLIGAICFYYGFLTYIDPINHHGNSSINTDADIDKLKNVGITIIVIGSLFYLPVIISSVIRILKEQKNNANNKETLTTLVNYLDNLNKSK
jgi:hypothetical protein